MEGCGLALWCGESASRQRAQAHQANQKTRSGERDVLSLPPAMQALQAQRTLTELKAGRIFYNPRTGEPWETDGQITKTAWIHILRRAGVRYRNPYQTRHTYASTLLSAGENPMWVAQQMGHSDWAMIRKVYGRWISEVDPMAGQKIIAMLEQLFCDHPVTKPAPNKTNAHQTTAETKDRKRLIRRGLWWF